MIPGMSHGIPCSSFAGQGNNGNHHLITKKAKNMAEKQPHILLLWGDDIG